MGQSDFDKESEKIRNQIADIIRGGWDKMFKVFIDKECMKLSNGIDHLGYHSGLMLSMRVARDAHDKCLYPDSTELEDFIKYIEAYNSQKLSFKSIESNIKTLLPDDVKMIMDNGDKRIEIVKFSKDGKLTISDELAQAIIDKIEKWVYDTSSNSK